ncbi:MAG: hypothetical protein WED05_11180 [Candidatus Atabeyarchaeum deiterrae]
MAETEVNAGSAYRVKFERTDFLELVRIAQPKIIYRVGDTFFFSFDGFVVFSRDCKLEDFAGRKTMVAIEFSNYPWQKE